MKKKRKIIDDFNLDDIEEVTDEKMSSVIKKLLQLKEKDMIRISSLPDVPIYIKIIINMLLKSKDRGSVMQLNILLERLFGKPYTKDSIIENIQREIVITYKDEKVE